MMKKSLKRDLHSCKNKYGHVLVLAGSRGMAGAAYMSAFSALISGAGKVTLGVPEGIHTLLAKRLTEVMTLPLKETSAGSISNRAVPEVLKFIKKTNAVALGPGLTAHPSTRKFVRGIVGRAGRPLVLDADGINCLRGAPERIRNADHALVVTPHEGEYRRLTGAGKNCFKIGRKEVAKNFAREYDCTLVLKGYRTVVADGGGRTYVNRTGNPGMATGGTGDVLTGMIVSFIAQGFDSFFASRLAVYAHGLAGDWARRQKGETALLATDLFEGIVRVLKRLEKLEDLKAKIRMC